MTVRLLCVVPDQSDKHQNKILGTAKAMVFTCIRVNCQCFEQPVRSEDDFSCCDVSCSQTFTQKAVEEVVHNWRSRCLVFPIVHMSSWIEQPYESVHALIRDSAG